MNRPWLPLLMLACAAASPSRAGADPVALLTELEGEVRFQRAGRSVELAPVASVEPGTELRLAPGARAVLAYTRGGWVFELRGEGRFVAQPRGVDRIDGSGAVQRRDLPAAFRALRIREDIEALQAGAAMREAGDALLQARGPQGALAGQGRPVVCWNALGPRWSYRLRLVDAGGSVVFESTTADSRQLLPPLSRLEPGMVYVWELAAWAPYGRGAEAAGQFSRLPPDREAALRTAARELARTAGDAMTERRLLAVAQRQYGVDVQAKPARCGEPEPGA